MLTRRDVLKLGSVAPLAAMSQPVPHPVYEQYIPLMTLPMDVPSGLGVGAPWQMPDSIPAMLDALRPAWWYDWRFEQAGAPGYVPMIWSDAIWADHAPVLESLFERRRDLFWLLWNEPELEGQANMAPELTATLTAKIAAYGIRYAAPGVSWNRTGMEWMDAYLAAGGPVPRVWHIHIYGSLTPAQWHLKWAAWCVWMRENGCERPTIVSETNGWSEGTYGQQRMIEHMATMLETDDLLRAVAWFATRWPAWGVGAPDLLNENGGLTSVGQTFAEVRQ
ncbi:MAG: hypothetical protein KDE20_01095 [Caldilineaceae bacterium]|nr:hypothetical protein [Caldilineaceae bacterium]